METTTEVENGFKETEIGLLPKEWDVKKIGDIITLSQYGLSMKGEKSGQYPILRMKNLEDGRVSTDDLQYVNVEESVFKKFKLNKNDILFNRTNSIDLVGKTSIFDLDMDVVFASYLIRLATKREVNPHFLNFFLNWHQSQVRLKGLATRAVGQSNISATRLKTFLVPIPPYVEQERISSIMFSIQNALEQQDKIIRATENLKTSLMQKLFTEGIAHTEFKNSEIGEIPKSWKITNLEDVGTIVTGKTPSTKRKEYFGGKIHFITPGDLGKSRYIYSPARFLTEQGLKVSKALPKDTVLVVCIGSSIGKTGMVYVDKSVTNQQINAVICSDFVDPHYLYHYLTFRSSYIISLRAPTPVPILNKSNFGKAKITLPPEISEQKQIAKILNSVDLKVELAQKKKSILQQLFKTTLNKLMTGEIRVNNLDLGVYDVD